MNLSKSKYCKGIQCKKILWLDENRPEEKEEIVNSTLDNGSYVGEIAKDLFGFHFDVSFDENLNTMINDTKALLLNNKVVITEASFKFEDNFCSVDILKKDNDNYEIYEVKSSTEVKDIYIEDLSYQYYILTNLGYNVTKASIVYINSKYVRKGNLELDKLFIIKEYTDICKNKISNIKENIKEINEYTATYKEPFEDLDNKCFKPYECPYFKYCSGHLDKDNVFSLRRLSTKKKVELYKKGYTNYKELLNSNLNDKYKIQIEYSLFNKEDYIDKKKIKEFLDTLSYPLYFLDFETFQQSIPEYDNVRPYEQIPFQYSLHYIENNILKHKEFLANENNDPRKELALSLINDIPTDTCVLAYNMSFEKTVIKSLANLYPDLKEHLMNIHDNIKDLMIPFYNHDYYTKEMQGSYSIKYVLPALFPNDPELDYHNLDLIHNGSEAMNSFAKLKEMEEEEKNKTRECLLKYCELDTYAMVKIYEKLKEVTKK